MKYLKLNTSEFIIATRGLNDIELGALMRALIDSALDDGEPKNVLESSYFGVKTNGFIRIGPNDTISATECRFARPIK